MHMVKCFVSARGLSLVFCLDERQEKGLELSEAAWGSLEAAALLPSNPLCTQPSLLMLCRGGMGRARVGMGLGLQAQSWPDSLQ